MANVHNKRVKNLMKSIRQTMAEDRIWTPGGRKNANWPICMTCGREPYAVELMDLTKTSVEIRVKCGHKHYASMKDSDPVYEDWARVDVPFGHGSAERDEHIGMALKSIKWFDPTRPPK